MRENRIIIIGILVFFSGIIASGQDSLVDITTKCRPGHNDLILNVVDRQLDEEIWTILVKGLYKGDTVGFQFKMKDGISPGLVEGEIDNTSWARKAAELSGIGEESDNFVKAFSELYSMKVEEPFTSQPIIFTCFSLNSDTAILEEGLFQFKLYFDDSHKTGLYAEVFFNINLPGGIVEFPDKDPRHIMDFIKAMIR